MMHNLHAFQEFHNEQTRKQAQKVQQHRDYHERQLIILVTSDLHGYIFPTDYRTEGDKALGFAKIASLIEQERAQAPELLLIDNGDLLQGSPFVLHHARNMHPQSHPLVEVYNLLNYDAAILGNHEFNFGRSLLDQAIADSNFPWLSAGILDSATGFPAFGPPFVIKTLTHGLKVAILGLTTHYIPAWERPEHIQGLTFENALHTARYWIPYIHRKHKPDVMVVAYHGGFERDLDTGKITEEQTGENQGYALLHEVDGMDVLITGHQHRMIAGQWNQVACLQPGSHGQALGKVVLTMSKDNDGWHIRNKEVTIIKPDTKTNPHKEVVNICAKSEQLTQKWLDQTIGTTTLGTSFVISDPFSARTVEHPLIELINRVQMEVTGVDISCTSLFSNNMQGFQGAITMRDIWTLYMYPNTLKVLRISGHDIKEALEKSATYFTIATNGKLAVHPDYLQPKPQHYNYDMWEGIRYVLDITKAVGQRVTLLQTMDGQPLVLDQEYDVVMNHYRASGGGNFTMFKEKPVVKEVQTDMVELLADYIRQQKVLQPTCNYNWIVIPTP